MGWSSLFWVAFKRSNNGMALLDEQRCLVEVNGALLRTLGRRRDAVVGARTWEFVRGGPRLTEREWKSAVEKGDFFGDADLVTGDGSIVAVHYAAHPETMTGRRLILFVALDTARHGRFQRRAFAHGKTGDALSAREREVVHLVALGRTGPEIADELHISHDTVRTHVRNAQEKLGARSRAQLVAMALGDGHTAAATG